MSTPSSTWLLDYVALLIMYVWGVYYVAMKARLHARPSLLVLGFVSTVESVGITILAGLDPVVMAYVLIPVVINMAYYVQYRVRDVIIEPRPVLINGLGIALSPILGAGVLLANALATTPLDLALVAILLGVLITNTLVIIIVLLYEESSGYMP